MHKRAVRAVVLVVLLALGIGAAVETVGIVRRQKTLESDARELSTRVDRIDSAITFVAAAQHTYVGSGQPDELSLNRVSVLVKQITNETASLRARTRAPHGPTHLQAFANGLAGLIQADERAVEQLGRGQALAAADIVFRESRESVAVMKAKLREFRYAESAAFDAEKSRLEARSWALIGGTGALWALGLLVFARIPRIVGAVPVSVETAVEERRPATVLPQQATGDLDLQAAAELCTAISRLSNTEALPSLLERAGTILGAPGLVVWMGAGEELFPAAAYGYDTGTLNRLGQIGRHADNATAAAWRTGQLRTVSADEQGNGALVVPMFSGVPSDACIGVVALELRHGREADSATRAVASMIAAQLATVLPAWPAGSTSTDRGSERHAAAS